MNDQRDILEDVLGKEWHPFITFEDIFKMLPDYFKQLKERESSGILWCDQKANFELNSIYDVNDFKQSPKCCQVFTCTDI